MPIDPLPTPVPSTDDIANFDARADAFLGALPDFADQATALEENVEDLEALAAGHVATATTKAAEALASAGAAAASQAAALGSASAASASAGAAAASEGAAQASATAAANYAAALTGTSSTSVTVGQGTKSFSASTGKQWIVNATPLMLVSAATPSKFMFGLPSAYNQGTGALDVVVTAAGGTGSANDWVISPAGLQGPQGVAGGGLTHIDITGNAIATNNRHHDVKAAANLTLPTSPTAGDRVAGTKMTYANTAIVSNKPINGIAAGTFPWNRRGSSFDLTFKDNTDGWVTT